MGNTLIEKIIMKNTQKANVAPGEIVTVDVDRVMIHDIFIPFVADKFKEMGFTKLWDSDKVVLIYDHLVPTSAVEDVRHFQIGDAFAKEHNLKNFHKADGICHQLMTECGYAKPGDIVLYKFQGKEVVSHTGIVSKVNGSALEVIEGNYKDSVDVRKIKLSYKYIDSYIEVR